MHYTCGSQDGLVRESVDVLLIHEPDRPGQSDWWTDWERFTGPVTVGIGPSTAWVRGSWSSRSPKLVGLTNLASLCGERN